MTIHANYNQLATDIKAMNKKGAGIFGLVIGFAIPLTPNGIDAMKDAIKAQEKLVEGEKKVKLTENSTYKVAKSIVTRAVENGIPLTNADGKPKGKTELEDELDALKEEKSPLDKFNAAITAARKVLDKLNDAEILHAAASADLLYKDVLPRIKKAA